jgi:hypothetical protein
MILSWVLKLCSYIHAGRRVLSCSVNTVQCLFIDGTFIDSQTDRLCQMIDSTKVYQLIDSYLKLA